MRARPPTSISGFGVVTVSGRMRLPRPAARIIARLGGIGATFQSNSRQVGGGRRGGHHSAWLREAGASHTRPRGGKEPDAPDCAPGNRPGAEDAGRYWVFPGDRRGGRRRPGSSACAPRRESHRPRRKASTSNGGVGLAPACDVAGAERRLQFRRYGDARVLAERGDVIGRRPDEHVLEVDEADAGDAAARSGSQKRFGDCMSNSTQLCSASASRANRAAQIAVEGVSAAERSSGRPETCGTYQSAKRREVGHQHLGRERQQAVLAAARHRQHGGARLCMDGGQHIDRREIALGVGRAVDDDALCGRNPPSAAGPLAGRRRGSPAPTGRAERRVDRHERRRRPARGRRRG